MGLPFIRSFCSGVRATGTATHSAMYTKMLAPKKRNPMRKSKRTMLALMPSLAAMPAHTPPIIALSGSR